MWQADLVELSRFAFGCAVGVLTIAGRREGRCAVLGGVEEGVVPDSIAASRVVDDLIVRASLEKVADGEVEGEVVCLGVSATLEPVNQSSESTSVSVDEYSYSHSSSSDGCWRGRDMLAVAERARQSVCHDLCFQGLR